MLLNGLLALRRVKRDVRKCFDAEEQNDLTCELENTVGGLQATIESELLRAEVCLGSLDILMNEKGFSHPQGQISLPSLPRSLVTQKSTLKVSLFKSMEN